MNTSAMRPHEFVKELTDAGMPEKQAEIIVRRQTETKDNWVTTQHLDITIELLKKDLIRKLGALIVGGFVGTIGIILGFLPLILN